MYLERLSTLLTLFQELHLKLLVIVDKSELAELAIQSCITHLPASPDRQHEYRAAQNSDPLLSTYCRTGWSGKEKVNDATTPYWESRGYLTIKDDLLLYGSRIVVPAAMQQETLSNLHEGHLGIERCRIRAQSSVWWPGISKQIEKMVRECKHCAGEKKHHKEPLMPTTLLPTHGRKLEQIYSFSMEIPIY